MPDELRQVFGYCYGFGGVNDAAGFADFVVARQIETTMPFNDYWVGAPPLPSYLSWLAAAPIVTTALAGWIAWGLQRPWPVEAAAGLGLAVLLLAPALAFDVWLVMTLGKRPFPAAPNATLPHVLKALYLQQAFTRFAAAHQGDDPATLRRAFADFVGRSRPDDLAGPTQPPGVVRSQIGQGA
jgi:hypothetical protein